jgi:hypothetical protein
VDAAAIQKVTLIRLASVTHGFNQNQRMNILQFTPGTGGVDIAAPANANIAPPGHYMLFLVNGNGVPSMGSIVQLSGTAPPPPPPGPTYTLTVSRAGSAATRGTITSGPAGINCGSICTAAFGSGSSVTLTATTTGNGVFAGWGGACSGTAPTCTLTMDGNKTATATINRR